ncbi:MAG TPA: UdgX family uracil-DNA binding protein [Polyangia bacterium]|nr:UdgX family uracil-DNA binding protein [Polyangia bacterium]
MRTYAPIMTVSLKALRQEAASCTRCDLYKRGTQTVFGEGSRRARVVLVGEQPGDQEDKQGRPFVGPAGRLLDQALVAAGIDRDDVYVTNAVKHFKWEPRGKRRIHHKPNAREIAACRPWLEAELAVVRPEVVVALGATAAKALFGPQFRVTVTRGQPVPTTLATFGLATVHPSSILRERDDDARHRALRGFVADLMEVAKLLQASSEAARE